MENSSSGSSSTIAFQIRSCHSRHALQHSHKRATQTSSIHSLGSSGCSAPLPFLIGSTIYWHWMTAASYLSLRRKSLVVVVAQSLTRSDCILAMITWLKKVIKQRYSSDIASSCVQLTNSDIREITNSPTYMFWKPTIHTMRKLVIERSWAHSYICGMCNNLQGAWYSFMAALSIVVLIAWFWSMQTKVLWSNTSRPPSDLRMGRIFVNSGKASYNSQRLWVEYTR